MEMFSQFYTVNTYELTIMSREGLKAANIFVRIVVCYQYPIEIQLRGKINKTKSTK